VTFPSSHHVIRLYYLYIKKLAKWPKSKGSRNPSNPVNAVNIASPAAQYILNMPIFSMCIFPPLSTCDELRSLSLANEFGVGLSVVKQLRVGAGRDDVLRMVARGDGRFTKLWRKYSCLEGEGGAQRRYKCGGFMAIFWESNIDIESVVLAYLSFG
jgi:hypothetical protein